MAEPDPVDELEKLGKQMASTAFEIFKTWKSNQDQAKRQAVEQQRAQQAAMEQQQKLLDGFREIMQGQNQAPLAQGPPPLTQAQTQALDDIAQRETAVKDSIAKIDERLEKLDAEQGAVLNPRNGAAPDTDRLRELHDERTKLNQEKAGLNEELEGLSAERTAIQQGKQPALDGDGVKPQGLGGVELDPPKPEIPEVEQQELDGPEEQVIAQQEQPEPVDLQKELDPGALEAQKPAALKPEAQKLELKKFEVDQLQKQLDGVETRLDEIQMQQDYLNKVVPKDQWTQEDTQSMAELEKEQTSLKNQKAHLEGKLEDESRKLESQEISAQIEGVDGRLNEIQEQQDHLKQVPKDEWTQQDTQAVAELEKEQTSLKKQKANLETQKEKLETDGLKTPKVDGPKGPELGSQNEQPLGVKTALDEPKLDGLDEPSMELGGDTLGLDEDSLSLKQSDISSLGMKDESPEPLGKGSKLPEGGLAPPKEGIGDQGVGVGQIKIKGGSPGMVTPKNSPLGENNSTDHPKHRKGSTGAALEESGYFKKRSQSMPSLKVGKGVS